MNVRSGRPEYSYIRAPRRERRYERFSVEASCHRTVDARIFDASDQGRSSRPRSSRKAGTIEVSTCVTGSSRPETPVLREFVVAPLHAHDIDDGQHDEHDETDGSGPCEQDLRPGHAGSSCKSSCKFPSDRPALDQLRSARGLSRLNQYRGRSAAPGSRGATSERIPHK